MMTDSEKAELLCLRDALVQAQNTVEFLYGCLTNPSNGEMNGGFTYAYPEQTLSLLKGWAVLAPKPPTCHHSRAHEGCESCRLLPAQLERHATSKTWVERIEAAEAEAARLRLQLAGDADIELPGVKYRCGCTAKQSNKIRAFCDVHHRGINTDLL
jgi:hypothetical protein